MHIQNIEQLVIHKVGNPSQNEQLFLSNKTVTLSEDLNIILGTYFLSAFQQTENYQFYNNIDIKFNVVYDIVQAMFDNPDNFLEKSTELAKHLFEKSQHPKIKGGELYIASFSDCLIDGKNCNGIGIFKSENKDTFLKIYPEENHLSVATDSGINIQKLDKGCIIFNVDAETGYQLAVVDKTNKGSETVFWFEDFLSVRQIQNNYFQTEKVIEMCNAFVHKVLPESFEVNKADQADMLKRSSDYLKAAETFNLDEFADTISDQQNVRDAFINYKSSFEEESGYEIEQDFEISDTAFKKKQRFLKSIIKLDKNFSIYVHGNTSLIEQGIDELGRKFYKFYYDNEA